MQQIFNTTSGSRPAAAIAAQHDPVREVVESFLDAEDLTALVRKSCNLLPQVTLATVLLLQNVAFKAARPSTSVASARAGIPTKQVTLLLP